MDTLIERIAKKWAMDDLDAAMEWVETLPDDRLLTRAASGLASVCVEQDPEAALAWTEQWGINTMGGITSLRDLTSTVTVEGLALGLPVVCLDHCGFADVVDETCGIKVPVTTPARVVSGLATAIHRLAQDGLFW